MILEISDEENICQFLPIFLAFLVLLVTLWILHYLLNHFPKVFNLLATMQMLTVLFSLLPLVLGFKIIEVVGVVLGVMKEEP